MAPKKQSISKQQPPMARLKISTAPIGSSSEDEEERLTPPRKRATLPTMAAPRKQTNVPTVFDKKGANAQRVSNKKAVIPTGGKKGQGMKAEEAAKKKGRRKRHRPVQKWFSIRFFLWNTKLKWALVFGGLSLSEYWLPKDRVRGSVGHRRPESLGVLATGGPCFSEYWLQVGRALGDFGYRRTELTRYWLSVGRAHRGFDCRRAELFGFCANLLGKPVSQSKCWQTSPAKTNPDFAQMAELSSKIFGDQQASIVELGTNEHELIHEEHTELEGGANSADFKGSIKRSSGRVRSGLSA
ncbi:hypothetical protein niasHT_025528 [Heterodera trifolii]|uniref:Uncharacterized protein n=1 Tax=Heterodera trifolii TaxID=157864 RepID=A0ABD2J8T5_9BILA